MKILAVDTATRSGSVALTDAGNLIAELTVGEVGTHSEWLLGAIDTLIKRAGLEASDIDLLALGIGPGSFTGLRIGVSVIKGLSWSLDKPVIGVSTLEAMAMNVSYPSVDICPVLDARKKEVYTALFRSQGHGSDKLLRVTEDSAVKPEALVKAISGVFSGESGGQGHVLLLGDGLYGEQLLGSIPGSLAAPEYLWHSRAVNIAAIARRNIDDAKEAKELIPVYLRKSEAELKREASV